MPGSNVTTTVMAHSTQGLALTYTWTVSGGWTVTGGNTPTATITAPATYAANGTATVEVSDTNGMYAMGTIALSTEGDAYPVINSISIAPSVVGLHGKATAIVSAYDPQGNTLTYSWSASAGWTVIGYGTTATVTAPLTYNTIGYITATVSDNLGLAVTSTIMLSTASVAAGTEFTYAVGYYPYGIATDASGNVWVVNSCGTEITCGSSGTVNEIIFTAGYVLTATINVGNMPYGIAIDHNGNVLVTNNGSNTVSRISGGVASTFTSVIYPMGIALDQSGNVWVDNGTIHALTELDPSTGNQLQVLPVCTGPQPIAIDASGNVWVGSYGGSKVSEVTTQFTGYTYALGYQNVGMAIDQSGNIWVSNDIGGSVYEITSTTGTPATSTVISGLSSPQGIAIDQAGNVWVVNYGSNKVKEFSSAGTLLATYPVGANPAGLAIDTSGNVWVTNHGDATVTEIIGVASGPQYFPCQYSTVSGNTCPQFQGGGNWGLP